MSQAGKSSISDQIINKARSLGASLAGIASVELLKISPSHDIYTKIEPNQGIGSRDFADGVKPGEVAWPPSAKSALVIALAHKEDDLQLDWWIEYEDDRETCRPETEKNLENKEFIQLDGHEEPVAVIKFCRLCELSCPVGKG